MSNKSTQFAQNTNIAKQNLRNGKTIDYAKNLAEFRNVISYIDAQLKEGKDNPLIIKTCQNLIRTISGLDLPADVKRHELAVAPSGVQKLYQQMGESKNGNSGSSKLRQEAMHNAIQQSLKDQIANLHNMSKAERMEFYKRIMTAESLQEAINNGFIVNDEYVNAFLDKANADAQRLEYLKNRIAELNEKRRNGTITQAELQELEQCNNELPVAEEKVANNNETRETIITANENGQANISKDSEEDLKDGYVNSLTMMIVSDRDVPDRHVLDRDGRFEKTPDTFTSASVSGNALAGGVKTTKSPNYNKLGIDFGENQAREAMKNNGLRTITGVSLTNDDVQVDVSRAGNFNSAMLDITGNESTGSLLEAVTSPKGFTGTNFASTFIENHNVDKVANEKVGENFATSKEFYTKSDIGDTITLSSAQKNEFTEENNIIVGGREDLLAIFDNRTDVNAKEVFNLNTAGYEFNNIPQTSSANEPEAGLDEVEKAIEIAKLEEKVKNGLVTQEERQELEQVQLEMVKANQQANENKYISSFIQVNTQPKPIKTDENNADENKSDFQSAMSAVTFGMVGKVINEASNKVNTEEHNKPIQNNEADVQAFIQNNASFGLEESIITTAKMDDKAKSLKQSDFLNQIDTLVLSSCAKVIKEKSDINKVVSNTTAKPNKATEPKKESTPNKPLASNTEQKNDLASNATAKPNNATEPKKESSLNKTLAKNTEQKNDFAPNTTTQTSDITENKNDIFNQSFAPTTDVTSYDVSTNFTLSDSSGQQGSSLTGALSAASYNPYEPMMPSFGNAR